VASLFVDCVLVQLVGWEALVLTTAPMRLLGFDLGWLYDLGWFNHPIG
jgi:hypothetical protein